MATMQALDVLRRELANVRASRDALAAVIGPHLIPEAADALAKLNEAADDLLEVVRSHGG
jgi:hypothetical protein